MYAILGCAGLLYEGLYIAPYIKGKRRATKYQHFINRLLIYMNQNLYTKYTTTCVFIYVIV